MLLRRYYNAAQDVACGRLLRLSVLWPTKCAHARVLKAPICHGRAGAGKLYKPSWSETRRGKEGATVARDPLAVVLWALPSCPGHANISTIPYATPMFLQTCHSNHLQAPVGPEHLDADDCGLLLCGPTVGKLSWPLSSKGGVAQNSSDIDLTELGFTQMQGKSELGRPNPSSVTSTSQSSDLDDQRCHLHNLTRRSRMTRSGAARAGSGHEVRLHRMEWSKWQRHSSKPELCQPISAKKPGDPLLGLPTHLSDHSRESQRTTGAQLYSNSPSSTEEARRGGSSSSASPHPRWCSRRPPVVCVPMTTCVWKRFGEQPSMLKRPEGVMFCVPPTGLAPEGRPGPSTASANPKEKEQQATRLECRAKRLWRRRR